MQPWVLAAKRLAVGQSKRFRCCGSTPAAIIFNNTNGYSMYCHRCKHSYFERKQFVVLAPPTKGYTLSLDRPTDDVLLSTDSYTEYLVYSFLLSKGMAFEYFPKDVTITYSPSTRRIIFNDTNSATVLGRYLPKHGADVPPIKWMLYQSKTSFTVVHTGCKPKIMILTEDYFSAVKVAYAIKKSLLDENNYQVIANLGTGISKALRAYVSTSQFDIGVCMFDGDDAGYKGAHEFKKRLRIFCPRVETCIHLGLDPKDMQVHDIVKYLIDVCR